MQDNEVITLKPGTKSISYFVSNNDYLMSGTKCVKIDGIEYILPKNIKIPENSRKAIITQVPFNPEKEHFSIHSISIKDRFIITILLNEFTKED